MTSVHKIHALYLKYQELRHKQLRGEVELNSLDDELMAALPWAVQELREKSLSLMGQEELGRLQDGHAG